MNRNARTGDAIVLESMNMCLSHLEELSHKLKTNREDLDMDVIVSLKDSIAGITKKVVTAKVGHTKSIEFVATELGKREAGENNPAEVMKKNVRTKIIEAMQACDPTKDKDYIKVASILMDCGKADDIDADMVMIDSGLTDQSIKCPYTAMTFVEPMKNPGGGAGQPGCIHHLSRAGLVALCKRSAMVNCPISGCKGKWKVQNAELDEDFARKIQRYLNGKRLAELAEEGGTGAEESKDDYTQL